MYGYGSLVYSYFWGELGLIVGWFWCRVCGISFGLNWEDIVAGGQGLFRDDFGSKTGVYRSCQGALWHAGAWKARCGVVGASSGMPGRGIHAVAWLGASSGTPGRGIHVVAWLGASSGTLRRGIPRYSVAPAQC